MDTEQVNVALSVVAALGVLGEALSLIPSIRANGIIQLLVSICKKIGGK